MIEIDTKILNFKHEIFPGVGTFGKFSCPWVRKFRKKLCPTPGEFTSAQEGVPESFEGSIMTISVVMYVKSGLLPIVNKFRSK